MYSRRISAVKSTSTGGEKLSWTSVCFCRCSNVVRIGRPPAHAVRRHGNIELDPLLGTFPEIAFVEHDGADRASRRSARGKSKCLLAFRR